MSDTQVEMSAKFVQEALNFCSNSVFKGSHRVTTMDDNEKLMVKNCFKKYMSSPNLVAKVLQNQSF
ncbi:unnamed protein product [Moneuplotes crassus]|uniref:Uncharacterized protein n=1 Tax=Euplotes crassus TaxID=5936 RepID=A0AAD1Y628_EUPCR|nr:unnamed protein product [Moneuplotes crassus]